jgi:hypothetical protein
MRKSTIVKLFIGSLIGLAAAVVLFLVAGTVALASDSFIMNGPDVVGVRPSALGWSMVGLAAVAMVAIIAAAIVQFVAWIGAVLNTAELEDKTWFVVLLVLGLVSLGFPAMIVYVIAGPDGTADAASLAGPVAASVAPPVAKPTGDAHAPVS